MSSLIIDTNNLLYRIYHIIKANLDLSIEHLKGKSSKEIKELTSEETEFIDELRVPLIQSFLRTLRSYVRDFEPDEVYSVWDKRLVFGVKNFRKEAVNVEYKAQRDYSEIKLMHAFDDTVTELMKLLGIKLMYPRIMEGDDVIAWLAHNLPGTKTIVSVDQDFLQLINENVAIYSPIKKVTITTDNLVDHTKVDPNVFVLYKAIMGDVGDNVPGLTGFGKVKAKKLAEGWDQYKEKLTPEQLEIVERNKRLMDLSIGYTVHEGEVEAYQKQLDDQKDMLPDFTAFRELCKKNLLNEITTDFSTWISPFRKTDPVADTVSDLISKLRI